MHCLFHVQNQQVGQGSARVSSTLMIFNKTNNIATISIIYNGSARLGTLTMLHQDYLKIPMVEGKNKENLSEKDKRNRKLVLW